MSLGNSTGTVTCPTLHTSGKRASVHPLTVLGGKLNSHCQISMISTSETPETEGMPSGSSAKGQEEVSTLSSNSSLLVKLLHANAKVPVKGSTGAIGYDLHAVEDSVIAPGKRLAVPLGIAMRVPDGTYGRIAPHSSLAAKNSVDIGTGVIDPDYRGEVKVLLINDGEKPFEIKMNDHIAQLILEQATSPKIISVNDFDQTA